MIEISTYELGDVSRVCHFHFKESEKLYHFYGDFERYPLAGMAEVYDDKDGNQMWLAKKYGILVGDIAIIKRNGNEGQLRWFGVAEEMQGEVLGKQLIEVALDFCKAKGYKRVYLETLDFLKPARHIYAKYGFEIIESYPFEGWSENRQMKQAVWELLL